MHYYAVIDTNVLVSAMLKFQSVPGQIANEALLGALIPLLSDEIVTEYREVLARPKFKFNQRTVDAFIDGIIDRGIFVDTVPVEEIIPYLVTGNIKHFPARSFVVTPKEMLDIIHNEYRIY